MEEGKETVFVESNEQTDRTGKIEIESRLTARGGRVLGGGGIKHKRKRTPGHGQQCGHGRREESARGTNGNENIQLK